MHEFLAIAIAAALLAAFAPMPADAALLTISTTGASDSALMIKNSSGVLLLNTIDDGAPESQLSFGNLNTSEARTAARAGTSVIGANAEFDDKQNFLFQRFETVKSVANVQTSITNLSPFASHLTGTFFLPPSAIEITDTVENDRGTLTTLSTRISATITKDGVEQFRFEAMLRGHYGAEVLTRSADGPADTRTTTHPTNFLETVLVEFPGFEFTLDFGFLDPKGGGISTTNILYTITAEVSGRGVGTDVIAMINDPFFFSGDLLPSFAPAQFVATDVTDPGPGIPVPEPHGLALLALPLAALLTRRYTGAARRRRASQ